MPKHAPRPGRAYSYVRFSTPQQAEGGSLDRQARLTAAYCQRKGLALDDSLSLNDLGVSAFRGANVRDGALAGFLEACRTGRVPRGSHLVIESLDRLSRDQIRPALQLFLALQDFGITIVTLQPEREYPPDAADALALIEPLIVFARAHEESAMKSHRRREGWKDARDKARQGRRPMTKTVPAWLEVTADGAGFRVKDAEAAAVRKIFALARDGLGVHRIAERMNREGPPPIGNGSRWVKAYIYKVLRSPAAAGTFQPQRREGGRSVPEGPPIPGFYPPIVTQEEWEQAQAAIERRASGRGAGRKGAEETNLFTGLLACALSGAKLHIINALGRKGAAERKRYRYLTPSNESGTSARQRIDYDVFEASILRLLKELRPSDIVGGAPADDRRAEIARLSARVLDLDSRLERARQRARDAADFDTFLDLIRDLQDDRKRAVERRAELEREEDGRTPADLGETQGIAAMLAAAPEGERAELRRRLKGHIRQLVATTPVVIVRRGKTCLCAAQLWFRGADRHRDFLIIHKPGTRYTDGRWRAGSLPPELAEDLDLRRKKDAAALAKKLARIDLDDLARETRESAKGGAR